MSYSGPGTYYCGGMVRSTDDLRVVEVWTKATSNSGHWKKELLSTLDLNQNNLLHGGSLIPCYHHPCQNCSWYEDSKL